MPKYVLFVHGYSEASLGVYSKFPAILQSAMPSIQKVGLAGFDSLDDSITIDDLAAAMEERVSSMIDWDVSDSAIICHSTGALIARRWILNRLADGKDIPSHLITIAGANHGSSLAHLGKSVLGYLQKLVLHHELSVGQGVLTDLEYGSDFLLDLNFDWLEAWNNGRLSHLYAFSMGGDTPGADPVVKLFWASSEPGTDNTVRISGANLNFSFIDVTYDENETKVIGGYPTRRFPHLVVPNYSHFGNVTGIIGAVSNASDAPMAAVIDALNVTTPAQYSSLEQAWRSKTDDWSSKNVDNANSTLVFTLLDRNRMPVDDCMIAILDGNTLGAPATALDPTGPAAVAAALKNTSGSVLPHSPIQNDTQVGSYSFYLNFARYRDDSPHWYHIDFGASSSLIGQHKYPYVPMVFTQPSNLEHTIAPNEVTYVRVTVGRPTNSAYMIWRLAPNLNLDATTFPPFTQSLEFCIAPPPQTLEK